jgi:hypothetical protein
MFGFGFSAVFILTQMHGTRWSEGVRRAVAGSWLVALVVTYAVLGRLVQWHEVLRIPVLDYRLVGLIAFGFFMMPSSRAPKPAKTTDP